MGQHLEVCSNVTIQQAQATSSNTNWENQQDAVGLECPSASCLQDKRKPPRNFGHMEPLATLADEFRHNQDFQAKVQKLAKLGYKNWRRIRGDGNCFYRAVGLAVLERLINSAPELRNVNAGDILQKLMKLEFVPNSAEQVAHNQLLKHLEIFRHTGQWEISRNGKTERLSPLNALYESLEDPHQTLDLAVIRALRRLTGDFLIKHANDTNFGCPFELAVTAGLGYNSLAEFCKNRVEAMGEDAEGPTVNGLAGALGVTVVVVWLHRHEQTNGHLCTEMYPADGDPELAVHVQFRPGHYDLLYPAPESGQGSENKSSSDSKVIEFL